MKTTSDMVDKFNSFHPMPHKTEAKLYIERVGTSVAVTVVGEIGRNKLEEILNIVYGESE